MIHLIISLYFEKNNRRWDELLFCLNKNISNIWIEKIHVLAESNLDVQKIPISQKINLVEIYKRPFISDFFEYANNLDVNDFKIISNSDIFFEDSINKVYSEWSNNNIYCLTRWDFINQNEFRFYENFKSQDVWIFKNLIPENIGLYYLGIPGCDNRLAKELIDCNFNVSNPSLSIKSIHVHLTEVRNYRINIDKVEGEYAYPIPTYFKSCSTKSNKNVRKKMITNYLYGKYQNNLEGSDFSMFLRFLSYFKLQALKIVYKLL